MNERAIPSVQDLNPTPEETTPDGAAPAPDARDTSPAREAPPAEQPRRYERPQMGNDIPVSIAH